MMLRTMDASFGEGFEKLQDCPRREDKETHYAPAEDRQPGDDGH